MARNAFADHSAAVLEAIVSGASQADAARLAGVGVRTVADWLEHGRREPEGRYGEFARAVDEARAEREMPSADELADLTEAEVRQLLSRLARKGNVAAIKLYLDRFLSSAPPDDAVRKSAAETVLAAMDELAERRRARVGG